MKTALEWKNYYSTADFKEKYIYEGDDLGVLCTTEGTSFRLWSPSAESVTLNLYERGDGGEPFRSVPMDKEDRGVWSWQCGEELHGVYYDYILEIDGETMRSADPYAKACGLNGERSMAVNLRRTDPEGGANDSAPKEGAERVIYELHVKEFSWDKSGGFPEEYRGKYKAFTCTDTTLDNDGVHPTGIPYLKELGVTHVQIMPAYDYGSVNEAGEDTEFNWGYDPVNYNVPEGSYSTAPAYGEVRIREMKEMVQSLHAQGFGVIMDVVYNHTYSLDSWFQRTAPWYFYRVFDNGRISNGSACGNDVASEREMCAKFILESVLYWTEEYHIDGFRFDLMGLLDVELMNRIRSELDQRYGRGVKLLFGEPWAADETAMEGGAVPALKKNIRLLDENIGMFCDDTRDAVKGSALKTRLPGFVNGAKGLETEILKSAGAWCAGSAETLRADRRKDEEGNVQEELRAKAPSQIITYVSAHDNQTLWDKLDETVQGEDLMRLNRMAAALYMTCQGTLFLLSGEEFARTKGGHDNSFNAPIALNRLDWRKAWEERTLVEYYKGLIALRKQLPGLCDKSADAASRIFGMKKEDGVVSYMSDNRAEGSHTRWQTLMIIYNSRKTTEEVSLPGTGWEVLCNAQSSTLWEDPAPAGNRVSVEPQSVMVLGCVRDALGEMELGRRMAV